MNRTIQTTIDGDRLTVSEGLIEKYDRPLPRYTSYPPIPVWDTKIGAENFAKALAGSGSNTLSLYVHIPFCRTRCTFCACHAIATTKTEIIDRYIGALITEMDLILKHLGSRAFRLDSLHWGGGTPVFPEERQMERLMKEILHRFYIETGTEVGIEADPRQTTIEKLRFIRLLGFNRISFGIQDTSCEVQKACGRTQDAEHVRALFAEAKQLGFTSVNADLCYGLPMQNSENFRRTIDDIVALSPDRIALFNFAFVPWAQPNQRRIDAKTLPDPRTKLSLFAYAIEKLGGAGYRFIGLDHFAKEGDELAEAARLGSIRRTFQGYITRPSHELVGLGVTSISEWGDLYVQNERKLADYFRAIAGGRLPVCRGYVLKDDDRRRRYVMQKIFCEQRLDKKKFLKLWGVAFDDYFSNVRMGDLERDGLVLQNKDELKITPLGRFFVRNVAALFDGHLEKEGRKYSRSV